jgi:hypothetical protein
VGRSLVLEFDNKLVNSGSLIFQSVDSFIQKRTFRRIEVMDDQLNIRLMFVFSVVNQLQLIVGGCFVSCSVNLFVLLVNP